METVRIGLIGAARVASYAIVDPARSVRGAHLTAIAARDPERASAFAERHGIVTVHHDYRSLFADPAIDLVYLATPPSTHADLAHRAIAAGKHILVEKPFAINATEAAAILDHTTERGVHAFEAIHAPHHALFGEVRTIVASGVLGRISRVNAHFSTIIADEPGEFRWHAALGGGGLMDLGVYPLALCRRLLGEDFRVDAVAVEFKGGVDARLRADLSFGDVAVRIGCSMIDSFDACLEIVGDHGTLHVRNPIAPSLGNCLSLRTGTSWEKREIDGATSWTAQLAAIVATLRDGAPYPFPADDPLASMRAIERVKAHPQWDAAVNADATAQP